MAIDGTESISIGLFILAIAPYKNAVWPRETAVVSLARSGSRDYAVVEWLWLIQISVS